MSKIEIGLKEKIHFIGIGGIGMSGLAQVMKTMGFKVQGSDLANSKNVERCKKIGIKVFKTHNKKNIKDMIAIEPNVSYAASFLIQLKGKYGTWEKAIKHYHSSDPIKNKPYLNKVVNFWKQKDKKIVQAIKKAINSQKISKLNNKSTSIKESQPYLFARIDKVNFFRKIFAEK